MGSPVRTRILQPMDLDVDRGASVAIVGPSGAGKTTLASIIGALQEPSEGSYDFAGQDVVGKSRRDLARFRSVNLGFVFQLSHLIDERSAVANVGLGLLDASMRAEQRRERSLAALEQVGLRALAERRAGDLSGGERHRVAIARALVKQPRLIIADEPTSALDQATGQAILDLLSASAGAEVTLIVVTHDQRAAEMADDVVEIVDGQCRSGAGPRLGR
ncbi:MAG: ABC transporter ATP-binding protein [Nocardioidaceae bacterium]|nr:ABC transporter ATP-binding protein [Nocardioidaceae bacterium]